MTELRIRNVDEWVVEQHRHNAKKCGVSLEHELKRVLSEAALARQHRLAEEIDQHLDQVASKHGIFPSSVAYIRAMREGIV